MPIPSLAQDPRPLRIPWRDLVALTRAERARELCLTVPWLAAALVLAGSGRPLAALPFSFVFFLAGLRNAHDAMHGNLGLPRRANDLFLFVLGVAMQGSLHAVQVNHRRHHAHCLTEADFEARSATMPGWKALLYGPVFHVLVHVEGLRHGSPRQRRWIAAELAAIGAWVGWVLVARPAPALTYHVLATTAGECLTAFFAVWTVHRGVDPERTVARTQRGLAARLALDMLFHVEHHLFPRVPTRRLARLSRRLDRVRPDLRRWSVLGRGPASEPGPAARVPAPIRSSGRVSAGPLPAAERVLRRARPAAPPDPSATRSRP